MRTEPTLMEFGNIDMKKILDKKRLADEEYALICNNACFICEKNGCPTCKHDKKPVVNAFQAKLCG